MVFAEATVLQKLICRIGIDQYHFMVDAGILTDDDPVELLEGLLLAQKAQKVRPSCLNQAPAHGPRKPGLNGGYVDSQEPVTLSDSEPEPDVMVTRGDTRQYLDRHPGPADIAQFALSSCNFIQ